MKQLEIDKIKEEIIQLSDEMRILTFKHFEDAIMPNCPFEENLLALLRKEKKRRLDLRTGKRIKAARFKRLKTLDDFRMEKEMLPFANFDKIRELSTCRFIRDKEDIIAIGPTGRGKTHLVSGIGIEAAKQGYKVLFTTASSLLTEMAEAKSEKSLTDYLKKVLSVDLLIVDDIGSAIDREEAEFLKRVISDRYECSSTIYTTNYEFEKWGDFISDNMVLHAIISRIMHHAHIINMNGDVNYRVKDALSKKTRQG
jgi:DNA replication protein DnaC